MTSSTLIAGPYLNEFGWELAVWQAAVRFQRISKHYRQVYVITFKNRECLYENCRVFVHDEKLIDAGFGISKVPLEKIACLVRACVEHFSIRSSYDLFTPNTYCSLRCKLLRRVRNTFYHRLLYYPPMDDERFDIAFHFRAFERKGDICIKSFPSGKADLLVNRCLARGLRVCCIGAPGYSYVPKGAVNRQSEDLKQSISSICSSRLVVGGSSAPMHLASLCGIPIVVWTGREYGAGRYFSKLWNPFGSRGTCCYGGRLRPRGRGN